MMTTFYAHVPLCLRYLVLWANAGAIWTWTTGCTRTEEFTATFNVGCYVQFFVWVFPHPSFFLTIPTCLLLCMMLSCLAQTLECCLHCMSLPVIGQGMPVFKWLAINRWSFSCTMIYKKYDCGSSRIVTTLLLKFPGARWGISTGFSKLSLSSRN